MVEFAGSALIPLIIGVIEIMKQAFNLHARFAPLVALLLGLFISIGWALATDTPGPESIARATLIGMAIGLSASGLYSGLRAQHT